MTLKKQYQIKINPDSCQSCGVCESACSKNLLGFGDEMNSSGQRYIQYKGKEDDCVGCGLCYQSCPSSGTINIYEVKDNCGDSIIETFEEMPGQLYSLLEKTLSNKSALVTGNDAILYGALLAGCTNFFGYPITPATEIAEKAAELFNPIGKYLSELKKQGKYSGALHSYLQAESEVASINMLYGAAGAGARAMTATSSPGFSLMLEGISYSICAELPMVIANVMRGGAPGLANIAQSQTDYNLMVKAPGHGGAKAIVLAPNSSQEMCDMTQKAFDLAFKYRTPVLIAADGDLGHSAEKIVFGSPSRKLRSSPWALHGDKKTLENVINSLYLVPEQMEKQAKKLILKYDKIKSDLQWAEGFNLDNAELIVVSYGAVSKKVKDVINKLGDERVGLIRPQTLFPFPEDFLMEYALKDSTKGFLVVENSEGQMVDDVRLAIKHEQPVDFVGRLGGLRVEESQIIEKIKENLE